MSTFALTIQPHKAVDLTLTLMVGDTPYDLASVLAGGAKATFRMVRPTGMTSRVFSITRVEVVSGDPSNVATIHILAGEVTTQGAYSATLSVAGDTWSGSVTVSASAIPAVTAGSVTTIDVAVAAAQSAANAAASSSASAEASAAGSASSASAAAADAAASQASLSSGSFAFVATGTTVARTAADRASDIVYAADCGVSPSASAANNSVNIQLAFDRAGTAKKRVELPGGTLNHDATLRLPSGVIVSGAGSSMTVLNYTGTGTAISTKTPGVRSYSWGMRDLWISTSTGALGIDLDSVSQGKFEDVIITGFTNGAWIWSAITGGSVYNRFDNAKAQGCGAGWKVAGTVGGVTSAPSQNANIWRDSRATANTGRGWDIQDSNDNTIDGSQAEGNAVGFFLDSTTLGYADNNRIVDSRAENNSSWGVLVNSANIRNLKLSGNWYGSNGTQATGTATLSGVVAGDTLTVSGVAFTAVASGATGDQFNVGGTDDITATNLAAAIQNSASAAVDTEVTAAAAGTTVTITSAVYGTAGNSITLAQGGGHITLSGATLAGGAGGDLSDSGTTTRRDDVTSVNSQGTAVVVQPGLAIVSGSSVFCAGSGSFAASTSQSARVIGNIADSAAAVGTWVGNTNTLATAGGKIVGFCQDAPLAHALPVSYVRQDGGYQFAGSDVSILNGTGAPEGVVTAKVGSLYLRTDGGAGTSLYVKQSGTGNTGWAAK